MIRYRAILAAFVCFMGSIGAADCNEGHVHLSGPWGSAKFQVEVMMMRLSGRAADDRPQLPSFPPCCLSMSANASCLFG